MNAIERRIIMRHERDISGLTNHQNNRLRIAANMMGVSMRDILAALIETVELPAEAEALLLEFENMERKERR